MNPLCKVCGDLAAGFHFGVFTCEGCKSFFGRAFNKSQVIPECRKRSKCVINKITRTACKACRLTKCLQVGMSKDGSRFGRRSNWFKMKFRLADQPTDDQYARTPSELVDASAPGLHYSQPFPSGGTSADQLATEPHRIGLPYAFDQPQALAGPFYPAPVQYPFHPTLLHRAFEDFSNFYRHQQSVLQQQHHHRADTSLDSSINSETSEENEDTIEPRTEQQIANSRTVKSSTPSPISSLSSSSSSFNLRVAEGQEYPMDLSLRSRSPVDFSRCRAF